MLENKTAHIEMFTLCAYDNTIHNNWNINGTFIMRP